MHEKGQGLCDVNNFADNAPLGAINVDAEVQTLWSTSKASLCSWLIAFQRIAMLAATADSWAEIGHSHVIQRSQSSMHMELGSTRGIGVSTGFIESVDCKVGMASSWCSSKLESSRQAVFSRRVGHVAIR